MTAQQGRRPLRELPPSSPFAADDGACDPGLAEALRVADPALRVEAVVAALARSRVLVPVVAHARHDGPRPLGIGRGEPAPQAPGHVHAADGHAADAHAPGGHAGASTLTVAAPDGRSVLPVFSSVATLLAWRADARPMPVPGPRAALAAAAEADGLLVLDPAGPVAVEVPRPATACLARGAAWVPATRDAEVAAAVAGALEVVPGIVAAGCEPGRRAELAVVLRVQAGLDRAGLDALLAAAGRALAAQELVAERVDSLELRVVSADGAATPGPA